MYKWATNMTAQEDSADTTITGTTGIGTGITVTLAAGDEIVLDIGEIYIESSDTSQALMNIGIHDGTTFYSGMYRRGTVSTYLHARANTDTPGIITGSPYEIIASTDAAGQPISAVFSQRAWNLSTDSKTWKLAFKKESGTGCIILGSTNNAKWSIGVRREVV